SAGNLETNIQLPRRDEFGNLATSFNHMVKQVKRASDETLAVNAELNSTVTSYSKFVPHNFLQFLGHGRITDVKLGDQVQKEMCVLFTDIRSFTTLSEHMTPKENFDFINGYLGRVGPLVRKHHGFIDKYIGDAIMALFPGSAEDAVLAAIEIQQEIFVYNSHRVTTGKAPISVGVGVHFGNLMLGTVGEAERMEGTVISDAVNTASRLEGLTKTFGASIIVSDSVVKALKNPDYFQMRNLGRIKVKGKNQPLIIYEILDGGDSLQISRKLASRKVFERGLDHYYKMEFAEAAASFQRILEKIGSDAAALYYRKQSDHYRESGVPEDWAGVEIMDQKK
ncbi:MAG: adenylate/guanylate cyclase domain-containing protein, partial [Spirochaetia bacterium]|nr:adenylate/guanylate cyclase domain-containing protein [Spirochaetia bacterium]